MTRNRARIPLKAVGLPASIAGLVMACSSLDSHPRERASGSSVNTGKVASPLSTEGSTATCSTSHDDTHDVVTTFTSTLHCDLDDRACLTKALTFQEIAAATHSPRSLAVTSTITLGSDLVLKITQAAHGSTSTTDVDFGSGFTGIRHESFSSDGTTLSGSIDGRLIVPIPLSDPHPELHVRFVDHRPPPIFLVNPGVLHVVNELLDQVKDEIPKTCGVGTPVPGQVVVAAVSNPACDTCMQNCDEDALACDGLVAGGCVLALFGYGACVGAGMAGCAAGYDVCGTRCDRPGADCCPTPCAGGNCCDSDEQCTPGGDCCPSSQIICGNDCCQPGITACNQGTCCPANTTPCGSTCCQGACADPSRSLCCDPGIAVCGNTCCGQGEACATTTPSPVCCAPGHELCGTSCCQPGLHCQQPGDVCCSTTLCNGACCDSPDPGGLPGTCLASTNSCCGAGKECGSICCGSPGDFTFCADPSQQLCCNLFEQRCGSKCCPTGQVCDANQNCVVPPQDACTNGHACASDADCADVVCGPSSCFCRIITPQTTGCCERTPT